MDDRLIRLIDTSNMELLAIPDGGSIVITHQNGEQIAGVCKYLDSTHFSINGNRYHQMQIADMLERRGAKIEIEKEPEIVGVYYRIIHRIPVGNKVYVMGHSPTSPDPYGTWQAYRDVPGKDYGHFWSNQADAWRDLLCRADAERTGKPYDHTKKYTQKNRNDAR